MNHDPAVAEAVVDGVWRLRAIPGANCYLVAIEGGTYALVDSGTPAAGAPILAALEQLEVTASTLFLTHCHWDHAGGAAALRDALDLTVVLGAGDVQGDTLRSDRVPPRFVRRWMREPAGDPPRIDEALSMEAELEVRPGILAIPTPGHTMGSVCYLLPDRELIFVGDVTLNSGDRLSRPLPMANDDTALQERSLRMLADRSPVHGAPGHGDPLLNDFGDWIRTLASMPPASGGSLLRVLRNPVAAFRFARRMRRS